MTVECYFCRGPVNPHDLGTNSQVMGWVYGPKKNGLRLTEPTDRYAHDACVNKAMQGQASDQPELPLEGIEPVAPVAHVKSIDPDLDIIRKEGFWPA